MNKDMEMLETKLKLLEASKTKLKKVGFGLPWTRDAIKFIELDIVEAKRELQKLAEKYKNADHIAESLKYLSDRESMTERRNRGF